jgi:hypothetical protein
MDGEEMTDSDLFWRLAPWLFLVAIGLTVVSFPPAEADTGAHDHHVVHGQDAGECGHDGHAMGGAVAGSAS